MTTFLGQISAPLQGSKGCRDHVADGVSTFDKRLLYTFAWANTERIGSIREFCPADCTAYARQVVDTSRLPRPCSPYAVAARCAQTFAEWQRIRPSKPRCASHELVCSHRYPLGYPAEGRELRRQETIVSPTGAHRLAAGRRSRIERVEILERRCQIGARSQGKRVTPKSLGQKS